MLCHLCFRAEEPESEPPEVWGVACRYLDLTLERTSAGFLQQPSLSPSELDELWVQSCPLYLKWFSFFTRLPPVAFLLAFWGLGFKMGSERWPACCSSAVNLWTITTDALNNNLTNYNSINANQGVGARLYEQMMLKMESHHCVPSSHTRCPVYSGYWRDERRNVDVSDQ